MSLLILMSIHNVSTWPISLTILQDKKTDKLLCLMGDYHAESSQEDEEKKNIAIVGKALKKILNTGNVVCLIEQSPEGGDEIKKEIEQIKNTSELKQYKNKHIYSKSLMHQLQLGIDYPSSAIISADWRPQIIKDLFFFHFKTVKKISKLFYDKILDNMQKKKLNDLYETTKKLKWRAFLSNLLKKEERNKMQKQGLDEVEEYYKEFFSLLFEEAQKNLITVDQILSVLKKQHDRIDDAEGYAPALAKSLITKLDSFSTEIIISSKDIIKNDDSIILFSIQKAITNKDFSALSHKQDIYKVLTEDMVEFGFIVEIEKAFQNFPIALLYAGNDHCNFIQTWYIKEKGYALVFETQGKSKKMPDKKDIKKFFDTIEKASRAIAKKKH